MKLWECPPFLFVIMGVVTIITMIATYFIASEYVDEPQIAALIVIFITTLFFVIGNLIINSFNRVAEANRLKSEFISIISHQLRSPLTIFKWTTDVIERELKQGRSYADISTNIQTLLDTTENMNNLVNALLDVSRIEAHTFILKKEDVSLTSLTQTIIKSFKKYAEATHIDITFHPDTQLPTVYADKQRVAMVIQNLIDNAIRYTPGSGHIMITICPDNNRLTWTITDQGIGIPPQEQKRIFEKFFRAESGIKVQARGTGIGLYVAKTVIEALKGHIGFRSEEGKGSTFWFTIPLEHHT